jgi:iron(III) transport system substrate-binding protein
MGFTSRRSKQPVNHRSHPNTRGRGLSVGAVAVIATVVLGGCGGSPTSSPNPSDLPVEDVDSVLTQAEKLSGQEQIDFLQQEAAKEGGPLRLYTSWSADSIDAIEKAFEDKYGIEVEPYRASSQNISQRVAQETSAGYADGADFVEMRGRELYQLDNDGMLRAFKSDFDADIPDYSEGGNWTADRLNVIVPCWNTNEVAPEDVPASYEELTSEKWRGRLVIEQEDANWFQTLFEHFVEQGKTEQEAEQYFRDIVKNGSVVNGHTEMQNFIVAGQYDLGIDCYTYVTDGQRAKGAPTAYAPIVEPAVIQPNGVAILKTAKHPASAALFYRWILTDGQQLLTDTGNTAVTQPEVNNGIPLDIPGFAKDSEKWTTLYDQILSGR